MAVLERCGPPVPQPSRGMTSVGQNSWPGMRHWLDSCRKMKMLCTMPQETGLMESLQRHTGQPHQRDQRRPHLQTDQYQFLNMGGATRRDIGPCLLWPHPLMNSGTLEFIHFLDKLITGHLMVSIGVHSSEDHLEGHSLLSQGVWLHPFQEPHPLREDLCSYIQAMVTVTMWKNQMIESHGREVTTNL